MIEDCRLIHTPAFSEDLEVQNMNEEKICDEIFRLAQIWALPRGNRKKLFRYLR